MRAKALNTRQSGLAIMARAGGIRTLVVASPLSLYTVHTLETAKSVHFRSIDDTMMRVTILFTSLFAVTSFMPDEAKKKVKGGSEY